MKITIIQVGKTKTSFIKEAEAEYLKRLRSYADVKIITLAEGRASAGATEAGKLVIKQLEAKAIISKIPALEPVIVLDDKGKEFSSIELAAYIGQKRDTGGGKITFIIGGTYGFADEVKKRATLLLSFSRFTFTHELIRVLLLEQIYRSFTILSGKTYHY